MTTNEIYPEPKTYEQAHIESLLNSFEQAARECDALRAECERLRKQVADQQSNIATYVDAIAKWRAENERLRAALEKIATEPLGGYADIHCRDIANEALGRSKRA